MRKKQLETDRLFFSNWTETDKDLAEKLWGDEKVTHLIAKEG